MPSILSYLKRHLDKLTHKPPSHKKAAGEGGSRPKSQAKITGAADSKTSIAITSKPHSTVLFKSNADISQITIIPKVQSFLRLTPVRSPEVFKMFEGGGCSGFGALMSYAMWLERQPRRKNEKGEVIERDDWTWLKGVLIPLSLWDGKDISILPRSVQNQMERFIGLVESFQHPYLFQAFSQDKLNELVQDTQGRKLERRFAIAGGFSKYDFKKPITLEEKTTPQFLLNILLAEDDTIVQISSSRHMTYLQKKGDTIYYIDSNFKAGFKTYQQENIDSLIHQIYSSHLHKTADAPFAFQVFGFAQKPELRSQPLINYPEASEVLAQLQAKERVSVKDRSGASALSLASSLNCSTSIETLIEKGAGVNARDNENTPPLYLAAQNGHIGIMETLIENGANVDASEEGGFSILHIATQQGHKEAVELLVKSGAKVTDLYEKSISPLHVAAEKGHGEIAEILLDNGADINLSLKNGATPLILAINNRHHDLAKRLIKRGANVNARLKDGTTALHFAVEKGDFETVQMMLERGATIEPLLKKKNTPLLTAVAKGRVEIAKRLIQEGANINAQTKDGNSALLYAASLGHAGFMKWLINKGADIDASNADGITPFFIATQNGKVDAVDLLINNKADINKSMTTDAATLLKLAPDKTHIKELFAEFHISTKPSNKIGLYIRNVFSKKKLSSEAATPIAKFSPVHIAALMGHEEIIKKLIKNGADIEAKTDNGISAWQLASKESIRVLLQASASSRLRL